MELITYSTSLEEKMEKYNTSLTKTKLSVKLEDLNVSKHGLTGIFSELEVQKKLL
jgi:hypothetical protein